MIGFVPVRTNQFLLVPISDTECWRYTLSTQPQSWQPELGGPPYFQASGYPFTANPPRGIIERRTTLDNGYLIDREVQKHVSFTGITDFRGHDTWPPSRPVRSTTGPGSTWAAGTWASSGSTRPCSTRPGTWRRGSSPRRWSETSAASGWRRRSSSPKRTWRPLGTEADPLIQDWLLAGWDWLLAGSD